MIVRLMDMAIKWIKGKTTDAATVLVVIITEQFLETLPADVGVRVNERKPEMSEKAGGYAED